jgi:ABC-2 type transport system permease protein
MDASLDLSRWGSAPRGVGYRRWTILSTGLRHLFRTRLFKILLTIAWTGGVLIAALGFLFSQSVTSGGWVESAAVHLGPRPQAIASALAAFVLMYPDICIGGWFTLVFWGHSYLGLGLSLIALTAMVPQLITRDRATNALTVYLSRPLTSADYLLGKLGMIVGVLVLLWTGPLVVGWLLSVIFAPDRDFIVYSFMPLTRALLFNGISLVTMASIALGVSALTRSSRSTTFIWIGLWLIVGAVATPPRGPLWLKRASFTRNLNEARQGILRLDDAFAAAAENLPIIDARVLSNLNTAGKKVESADFDGALISLAAFVALSSFVFLRRLRPE